MVTTMETQNAPLRRPNALGVHSVNRFAFSVPDLALAERFYRAFGLDARRDGNRLDLYTKGQSHCWGSVYENGQPKKLPGLTPGFLQVWWFDQTLAARLPGSSQL